MATKQISCDDTGANFRFWEKACKAGATNDRKDEKRGAQEVEDGGPATRNARNLSRKIQYLGDKHQVFDTRKLETTLHSPSGLLRAHA